MSGDLIFNSNLLRLAYAEGYFPMPEPRTGEILWFNPNPRAILPISAFHLSRSLKRTLDKKSYAITVNENFAAVMAGCSDRPDTWINEQFKQVYSDLHREGNAHSIEVWEGEKIVGGVYGVALGGAFFAESMFHYSTDASKVALYTLTQKLNQCGYSLLEVQFMTSHLASLGAIEIPAKEYHCLLKKALKLTPSPLQNRAIESGV